MTWDLLLLGLQAGGALTAGRAEQAPELAHHVGEGRIVAWYGGSGQSLRERVQHDSDGGECGECVLLSSPHLLLPGEISLHGKLCPAVLESGLCLRWR